MSIEAGRPDDKFERADELTDEERQTFEFIRDHADDEFAVQVAEAMLQSSSSEEANS